MKKLYFFTLVLFAFSLTMMAQNSPPVLQWQKCLGGGGYDEASSTVKTTDGGFVVAATDRSNGSIASCPGMGTQISLVKLSKTGSIQWKKCLGGYGNEEKPVIKNTPDGGFIVAAYSTSNDTIVGGNHGTSGSDVYVAKLDKNGDVEWQKLYGGSADDLASSIQVTDDGGYIYIGHTASNNGDVSGNHGSYDIWVVKISSTGAIQWQKCYGGSGKELVDLNSYSNGVIQKTSDAGYVFVAQTQSTDGQVSGYHSSQYTRDDIWVVKLNVSGDVIWQKCLGGSLDDEAADIRQTADGGYFIAGTTL